jgi:hypothetical protein
MEFGSDRTPATIYVGLAGHPLPRLKCEDNLSGLAGNLRQRGRDSAEVDRLRCQAESAYTRRIRIGGIPTPWLIMIFRAAVCRAVNVL